MDINYYKQFEPIDGKWYITKELGSGAFGTVFEVERHDFSHTKSAMKIISIPSSQNEVASFREENYDLDENSITSYFYGFVEEFVKEFQLMSKLRGHSNIVSYEDHDVVKRNDGIGWDIFIRMELLTPVNKYFATNTPKQSDIIKLGIDICKALEVCQKFKIIHRDIKPSNIFVSETGDYKLGDFGVARTLEKTSSGLSKKGTYIYMAPEVYKGEEYGSNVDIYSLGIVMYKMLNNNMEPFRNNRTHTDEENAMSLRVKGEIPIPKPANASGRLAEIVLKACSFSPKDRYESPLQMREELESILYTESESRVIYPEGDDVSYEPSTSGDNDEKEEKTEGIFDNQNIEDTETVGIFSDKNCSDKSNEHAEETVSMFSEKKDFVANNDENYTEQAEISNRSVKKRKKKRLLICIIAIVAIAVMAFAFWGIKNTNRSASDVISNVVALIEITDEDDNVILNNEEISSVKKCYDDELGYYLTLGLNEEGKAKFYEYTREHTGGMAMIYINKLLISAPTIPAAINSNDVLITGEFTKDDIEGWVEALQTEYVAEEIQEETTEDVNSTEETTNEVTETISVQSDVGRTTEQTSGKSKNENTVTTKTCSVCGSKAHTTHPTCPVCGSTSHTSHPTCSVCGSTSHTTHPQETKESAGCTICGSKYHDESVHSVSDAPVINKDFD